MNPKNDKQQKEKRLAPQLADLSAAQRVLLEKKLMGKGPSGPGEAVSAAKPKESKRPGRQRIENRPAKVAVPLSFSQQRLWLIDQLEPGNLAYNLADVSRIEGPLNIPALETAFSEIVRRHEALRTTFEARSGIPVQVIHAPEPFRFKRIDLPAVSGSDRVTLTLEVVRQTIREPFDLKRGPLLRGTLIQLDANTHILVLGMHHIVYDGWSRSVLFRELPYYYKFSAQGRPLPVHEMQIQYADYARHQAALPSEPAYKADMAYWTRQLAGSIPTVALPADRPRPKSLGHNGDRIAVEVPGPLVSKLKVLARNAGATPFMVLLALFNVLLYRYSGQADICVGVPSANRVRPELEGLIGFFVNTLVMRTDLSGNPRFLDLVARVRQTALDAFDHQTLPFEQLVAELQPDRQTGHSPLFQVMFAFQNAPQKPLKLHGLKVRPEPVHADTAMFDLTLFVYDTNDGLQCVFEFDTDLFDTRTIRRMGGHFLELLQSAGESPGANIADLRLMTTEERDRMLVEWNRAPACRPDFNCVHERVAGYAARAPDSQALAWDDRILTYRRINATANRLARYLIRRGICADTPVGLHLERSADMIIAVLAILKAGGAVVPLDPAYPAQRLAFIMAETRMTVVVTRKDMQAALRQPDIATVCLDEEAAAIDREKETSPTSRSGSENLAYILYTSGSTGKPKGVAMPHRALSNLVAWQAEHSRLGIGDRTVQFASLNFDVSFQEIFATLCTGGTLVVPPDHLRADPEGMAAFIREQAVARLFLPFVMLNQVLSALDAPENEASGLQEVITAGEQLKITPAIRAFFKPRPDAVLVNQYGPTESHVATFHELSGPSEQWPELPPIGRPIANTAIYILDADLNPVPAGVPGELHIGGICLAREYIGRPGLTERCFIPDPFNPAANGRLYKTGDLARYLTDGNIEFLGRVDRQVKVRGFRIEPGEIEAVLESHEAVGSAVIALRDDIGRLDVLVAYIVLKAGLTASRDTLKHFLEDHLPAYMLPADFVFLEALPRLPSGKVNHRGLPRPDRSRSAESMDAAMPGTDFENTLADIWMAYLGVDQVFLADNFFDLGGHSLLAVQVVAEIKKQTGVKVSPRDLIFQTIGQLAASYGRDPAAAAPPSDGSDQEPFFFGAPDRQLFSCLHPGRPGRAPDTGVVLCYPGGHEYLQFHRAYRRLALGLSRAGLPVLRFDYYGCGDSAGRCEQGLLAIWRDNIKQAAARLKQTTGCRKICLVGLRLGGSLALQAAAGTESIDTLVLWDPVLSGKRYIKDIKLAHRKMLLYSLVTARDSNTGKNLAEARGLAYSKNLVTELEKMELLSVGECFARRVLILESDRSRPQGSLQAHLESIGTRVKLQLLHEPRIWSWIKDFDKIVIPPAILQAIVAWVSGEVA